MPCHHCRCHLQGARAGKDFPSCLSSPRPLAADPAFCCVWPMCVSWMPNTLWPLMCPNIVPSNQQVPLLTFPPLSGAPALFSFPVPLSAAPHTGTTHCSFSRARAGGGQEEDSRGRGSERGSEWKRRKRGLIIIIKRRREKEEDEGGTSLQS